MCERCGQVMFLQQDKDYYFVVVVFEWHWPVSNNYFVNNGWLMVYKCISTVFCDVIINGEFVIHRIGSSNEEAKSCVGVLCAENEMCRYSFLTSPCILLVTLSNRHLNMHNLFIYF